MTDTITENDRSRVLVRLENGRTVYVDVVAAYGDYAVHHWVTPVLVHERSGFTVTHRPSGISVWSVETQVEAFRVAKYLHESRLLPSDPLALEHIMQEARANPASSSMKLLAELRQAMMKLAVRAQPPRAYQRSAGALT